MSLRIVNRMARLRMVRSDEPMTEGEQKAPAEQRSARPKRTLRGLAIPYGRQSRTLGGEGGPFVETIRSGAFRSAVQRAMSREDDAGVVALFNHDASRLLGRTESGTLRLYETSAGVEAEIDLPNTPTGDEVAELVERGDLVGMSFQFDPIDQESMPGEAAAAIEVTDAALYDVSIVTHPAYPDTMVGAAGEAATEDERSEEDPEGEPEEREDGDSDPTAELEYWQAQL